MDPIAVRSEEQQKVYKLVKELLNSYELNLQLHDFRLENKDHLPLLQFDVVVPENISLTNEQLLIGIEKNINQKIGSYAIELVFDRTYVLKK